MFPQGKRTLLLILAAATVGAVGCGLPPSRVEFIEKLAKDNRQIARSTRSFRSAILPLKDGNAATPAQVRSAYQEMEKALKEVRADVDGQLLPASSTSAKDFLAAYKTYLDGQQDILTNLMQPIVQEVELPTDENGDPTVGARWAVVDGLMKKVTDKERETWGALAAAQSAYASEHNYQVQSLADYVAALKAGK